MELLLPERQKARISHRIIKLPRKAIDKVNTAVRPVMGFQKVNVTLLALCWECEGAGSLPGAANENCDCLNGVCVETGELGTIGKCVAPKEHTTFKMCGLCDGSGEIRQRLRKVLPIPRGTQNNDRIVLLGEGHQVLLCFWLLFEPLTSVLNLPEARNGPR